MFSTEYTKSLLIERKLNDKGINFIDSPEYYKFRVKKDVIGKVKLSPLATEKIGLLKKIRKMIQTIKDEKITIAKVIKKYMELTGGLGISSIVYQAVEFFYKKKGLPVPKRPSIRGIMIDHEVEKGRKKTKFFRRIADGIYTLLGVTGRNVVNGDGRNMNFLEKDSIDCIITDHPWSDKKAHKAGNQSNFNDSYEDNMFSYDENDFKEKYRVLKEGGYLVEILPFFLHSNIKYLIKILEMALSVGFEFYSEILWVWDKGDVAKTNTGRTTKRSTKLFIFTKGKAKRLSPKGKPYMTNGNLDQLLFIEKPEKKVHQSEKPKALYRYLIDKLTAVGDVVLDHFAGACNIIEEAFELGRHSIAVEYNREFADRASERFGIKTVVAL